MDRQQRRRRTGATIGAVLAFAIVGACSSDDGASDAGTSADAPTTTEDAAATAAYDEAFEFCVATDFLEVAEEHGVPGPGQTIQEAAHAYSEGVSDVNLRADTFRGCLDGFQEAAG